MSLIKLILALIAAGVVLVIYASVQNEIQLIIVGLLLVLIGAVLEFRLRRPLVELGRAAADFGRKDCEPRAAGTHELRELAAGFFKARALLQDEQARLAAISKELKQSQALLRESEERYELAVRGANDGLLEWNLKTDHAYFSPRWKAMLGFADTEISECVEEWRDRIHPNDREHTLADLKAHLDSRTPHFENEHRLEHKDGSYRWILARGCAIRSASGKPYRLLALHTDITARKQVQEALLEVADGLEAARGEETFRVLTRNFASALGVREAFVCECANYPTTRVRILAWWVDGHFGENEEFDLTGTACEDIIVKGKFCYYPHGVGERFPLEKLYNRDGYLGIPIFSSTGVVIGHIACMHNQPMREELPHAAIFKIFAARAGIELERRLLARDLARSAAPRAA
ncbi:MAG: PAS domain-containing protein [Burkholderiales bacterium]